MRIKHDRSGSITIELTNLEAQGVNRFLVARSVGGEMRSGDFIAIGELTEGLSSELKKAESIFDPKITAEEVASLNKDFINEMLPSASKPQVITSTPPSLQQRALVVCSDMGS